MTDLVPKKTMLKFKASSNSNPKKNATLLNNQNIVLPI